MDSSELEKLQPYFKNMHFIEQFVMSVVSFTSKYNNRQSVSYAPENVIGKPAKYPSYGDFPDTYMLRSYGKWWSKSESAQREYMPQDVGPVISEDYIIVRFEQPVIPTNIFIYETYNPGAVVRIWGGNEYKHWNLLWEGSSSCREDATSRLFEPCIKIIKKLIHLIRIDFNQSELDYHTSIDAVLLAGYTPKSYLQNSIIGSGILHSNKIGEKKKKTKLQDSCPEKSSFFILPYEVIVDIFGYLDLKSLSSCAQVNRMFHAASNDSALYRNLCLKRYWHLVTDETLEYFTPKCKFLRKLDLSWCGFNNTITEAAFIKFLKQCGQFLTHLSLGNAYFLQQDAVKHISFCSELVDLRLRNCCPDKIDNYLLLGNLKNLHALDLYSSNIDDQSLAKILKNNSNLKHLNIDLCEQLTELDLITEILASHNKKVRSFSCWKTHSLTSDGIKQLAKCSGLRELDVGWCLVLNDPGDCLTYIAQGCPNLTKLIISCWRGLGDHQLLPIIRYCTKMKQLDLLGIRNITADICERALVSFRDLELLDVSFCDVIKSYQVQAWKQDYPHVTIQRSCEYVVREYWNQ